MHQHLQERGGTTALLVIDVQNAVVEGGWNREAVLDNIGKVLSTARETGVPVIYVQHENPGSVVMDRGAEGWHICAEVAPITGEPIVHKQYSDAFVETTLADTLAQLGVGHLIITGAQSDACVRSTTTRALVEGYDVTLVGDAHTTGEAEANGTVVPAEINVGLVNYVVPWIDYPNTVSQVIPHTEVIASLNAAGKD